MSGKSQIDATRPTSESAQPPVSTAWFDGVFMAIGFMTRLPVPFRHGDMAAATWAFPIAGAIVGAIAGGVVWGAALLGLPALACAFLALAASALVTGALHEDGLADCADGFWGGTTPERRLEIMRDSRSGAYGVLALVIATGLKASLVAALLVDAGPLVAALGLIGVHAVARAGLPGVMAAVPAPGATGLAASVGRPASWTALIAGVLGVLALLPITFLAGPVAAMVVVPVAAMAFLGMAALAKRKLGGVNGDSLGAAEQIAEIVCLAALAVLFGSSFA